MAIYMKEEIIGLISCKKEILCSACHTPEEWEDVIEDRLLTVTKVKRHAIDENRLLFCDRCGKQIFNPCHKECS